MVSTNTETQSLVIPIASAVTSVTLVVIITLVVIVVIVVIVRRYGQSKVVLQVTGDSIDIAGQTHFPSIIVQR